MQFFSIRDRKRSRFSPLSYSRQIRMRIFLIFLMRSMPYIISDMNLFRFRFGKLPVGCSGPRSKFDDGILDRATLYGKNQSTVMLYSSSYIYLLLSFGDRAGMIHLIRMVSVLHFIYVLYKCYISFTMKYIH